MRKRSRKTTALILSALLLLPLISLSTPPSRAMSDKPHYEAVWAQKNNFRTISVDSLGVWSGNNYANNLNDWNDPAVDKMAKPRLYGGFYEVHSADQLRYAMQKFENGQKIRIMRDIDFGGENWIPVSIGKNTTGTPKDIKMTVDKALHIEGNNKTLYNFYSASQWNVKTTTGYMDAGFVTELTAYDTVTGNVYSHVIKDLTFKNIKCDAYMIQEGAAYGAASPFIAFERGEITNVGIEDGLFHTTDRWAYGFAFLQRTLVSRGDISGPVTIKNSYTKNVVTMAEGMRTGSPDEYACTSSFVGGGVNRNTKGNGALIQNCYAVGNTVIALKGHAGGFTTCNYGQMEIKECFSDVTVLGGDLSGAFQGPLHDGNFDFTDCYSLGSVDGNNVVGGFAAGFELINGDEWREGDIRPQRADFLRCYSAAIVGMQENGAYIGSFMGAPLFFPKDTYTHGMLDGLTFTDCYAVGETGGIGSITRDVNASSSVGGFMGRDNYEDSGGFFPEVNNQRTFAYCYYDKQTTATREWATGTKLEAYSNYSTTYSPVKGVLTYNVDDGIKSGHGLAGGNPSSSSVSGFTGFSRDDLWVFKDKYYPQLAVFANANPYVWGRHTDLVKAYSEASASTVFLQPWENISDKKTYDTVRDMTLHFELTSSPGIRWDVIDDPYGYGDKDSISLQYNKGTWTGVNRKPGITWVEVTVTRNAGQPSEVQGKRRLRLIPIASLEAGKDEEWKVGETHAHYNEVLMLYSDAENLMQKKWFKDDYPLIPQHYFKDADARDYSHISVTGTPINASTVDPNTFQVNVNLANLPFNDRANEPDPDGWRNAFSGAAVLEVKHGGIFLLDYKWTLNDGRYLQDYKQVTIIKRAKATLEVRDQDNPDIVISNAMYLNLVRKSLDEFAFDDTGGLAGQRSDLSVPAGTAMIFAWKPGSESVKAQSVSVTVASQNTVLTDPQVGNTFTQNVTGYKDLRLVDDKYFYMTVVKGTITRAIQEKDGAMIISMVGTERYDGVDFPDFEDDVEVIVYVEGGDSFVTLNIRQQVLGTLPTNLKLPGKGIFRLHNIKFGHPGVYDPAAALPIASGSSVPTDPVALQAFTAYKLPLPSDKRAYRIEPIVPQYYNYAGYKSSFEYDDHDVSPHISSPEIIADYTDKDKLWVTVYLRAKPGDPADHTTELQPNEFKLVPGP